MTRRDFLKMMRDASVTVPALVIGGHVLQPSPAGQSIELKPPPLVLTGGSIEWSNAQWGYFTTCGT